MSKELLLYVGSLLPVIWGVSHLFPTRSVVAGFGDISLDNRRIITMEWIVEGVTLIYIGLLVLAVTIVGSGSAVASVVYVATSVTLLALALVSLFTGFRIKFLPFRLCPFVMGASAILILLGAPA